MNNTTLISDGLPYLRNSDIVLLIACFGFCAILTMLVIGQRNSNDTDITETNDENMVQLPIFLKWNTNEDEAECTFE
jgi:hypothetical protein